MSRPSSLIRPVCLLALCLALAACGTVYTDTFSPRLSRYEKPAAKTEPTAAELLPPTAEVTVPGPGPTSMPPVQTAAPEMAAPPGMPQ